MSGFSVIQGDALTVLRTMPDESVQCCVTSPPYFRQRNYGVDGQIGLEPTPEAFISRLRVVFAEILRVLISDGTCWVNIGDKYATGGNGGGGSFMKERRGDAWSWQSKRTGWRSAPPGYKDKELIGIPWMFAFAARQEGWYIRSEIIWHKPNGFPESCVDRPTRAHETVFLLTKRNDYRYDIDAIREPHSEVSLARMNRGRSDDHKWKDGPGGQTLANDMSRACHPNGRNKRTVWTIPVANSAEEHYAAFPEALAKPCILAGCHEAGTVLDPFAGSGTTGVVSLRHNRHFIGIELNPEYATMARRRISDVAPLLNYEVSA